jgi:hypothetical protein
MPAPITNNGNHRKPDAAHQSDRLQPNAQRYTFTLRGETAAGTMDVTHSRLDAHDH